MDIHGLLDQTNQAMTDCTEQRNMGLFEVEKQSNLLDLENVIMIIIYYLPIMLGPRAKCVS